MTTIYRPKTFPEVLDNMVARFRKLQGLTSDFTIGSWLLSVMQAAAMSDADIHVQMSKIPKLFSLRSCRGEDLDRRALDFGTLLRKNLRRLQAEGSTAKVTFGDGTLLVSGHLSADVLVSDTTFTLGVGEGDVFPSSGALDVERGTARYERVVFTRNGDVFTRVWPPAAFAYPHAIYGEVALAAVHSSLASGISIGGMTATLASGTGAAWNLSGTVIFEQGTAQEEARTFTRAGDVLSLGSGTTFAHLADTVVVQSTFGSDRVVGTGTLVYVPATESSKQVTFETLEAVTLRDGEFWTELVDALCSVVGLDTNVGSGTISKITSAPFSGAVVSNPLPAGGGRDREKDEEYAERIENFVASFGGRTALSIETHVVRLYDEVSNSRVRFAQVIEPVLPTGTSLLYISDGSTSFVVERETFTGRDVLISNATSGDRRGRLHAAAPFLVQEQPLVSRTPRVYVSVNRGESTSVGTNYLEDTTQNMTTDAFAGMFLKTADDQFYEILSNTAIRFTLDASGGTPTSGAYAVLDLASSPYVSSSSTGTSANTLVDTTQTMTVNEHANRVLLDSNEDLWTIVSNTADTFTLDAGGATPASGPYQVLFSEKSLPLVPGEGFNFNEANGDLEVADPLLDHDAVVAAGDNVSPSVGAYSFAKGLAALVQRAVNGDPTDFADFMGVRSHGVKVLVVAPTVIVPTFQIAVLPRSGVSAGPLYDLVKQVVQAYVNNLGMGDEIILSEIIHRTKALRDVADVRIVSPSSNVPVADSQLARITGANVFVF